MKCDISKELCRVELEWRGEGLEQEVGVETGSIVIGMTYVGQKPASDELTVTSHSHILLVVMQTRLLRLNANTLQLLDRINLSGTALT